MAEEETNEETVEETAAVEADASSSDAPTAESAEPEEKLHPKEARKRARSRAAGPANPQRSAEDRHAERVATRKAKAVARKRRRDQEKAKKTERTSTPPTGTPAKEHVAGNPQVRRGTVVSAKPDKTITVRIDSARRHRKYEKIVRSSTTLHAHDETNDANEGDVVTIVECRPLSRLKRWKLVEVVERAK